MIRECLKVGFFITSSFLTAQDSIFASPDSLLLNEVMANPSGLTALPETEYVEIYNASAHDVSLNGWAFVYDSKDTPLPDTVLPSGAYAVLFREGRDIAVADGAFAFGLAKFPAAIANTTKTIGLKNSHGTMIDELTYPNATAAKSYERGDDGVWHLSTATEGGTPGAINSPATKSISPEEIINASELVINEILAEPFNDAASEYIELYNRSDRSLSLTGVGIAIKKTDGTTGTVYPLFDITLTTIEPDSYIVLTKQASGVTDYYQVKQPETVIEVKLPVLNNEGATIAILNITDLSLIDEVSYTSKYHDASLKSNKGVSLERISPDVSSQEASNWASATSEVGYGTPGGKNSQYLSSEAAANSSNRMQAPIYIAGFDRYVITYQTSKAGFRCRAEVYSVNGNKVAEISNNHLLSQEGEISWDGKGLNNARLTRGVYIFYAELYHPDGNQQRIKQAFTVH